MSPPTLPADGAAEDKPLLLLVDDEEVTRLLTRLHLQEHGFRVEEADSGEQALALLGTHAPDLVMLDAMMPGLDGFATCRELRRLPGLANLPVLMLTGLEDDASINRAFEAGATDFFVKSQQWSLLAVRLQYLLRASRTTIELERSKAKLARAQDLARMGSFDWRRNDGRLSVSPEAMRVFGLGPHESVDLRALLGMVPQDERRALRRRLLEALRHASPVACDLPMVMFSGKRRMMHIEAEPEFNEQGHMASYTGVVQDVNDRREAEDQIQRLAHFDSLTNLPNRLQLRDRADRALEQARRLGHQFALLWIDLDRFKEVNDAYGHGVGDELLIEAARRLKACVRHSDQVLDTLESAGPRSHRLLEAVCRHGGDEFVALLPEIASEQDASRVADRIVAVMREPIYAGTQECRVTASVGVAIYPRDGSTVPELLVNADAAMYSVKNQDRNALAFYGPHLAGRGRERFELESALHKAIERDELVLHYQPKVDVRRAELIGVEALMRWQRGDRLVPPMDFIPLAEKTGLIVPMSEWVLREAARQARVWADAYGLDSFKSISVNLPGHVFQRSDLVEHIHQCVREAGVPHRVIMVEITENTLMSTLENITLTLDKLNQIGVEVSIDDFGSGATSLSALTGVPISELKIDRSFVQHLDNNVNGARSAVIAEIIIDLGRKLGLRVVAEGVERLGQMEELRKLGCHLMQGFLFSRALPADELGPWLDGTQTGRGSWPVAPRSALSGVALAGAPALAGDPPEPADDDFSRFLAGGAAGSG